MHRSSSASRVSEPYFNHSSSSSSPPRSLRTESDAGDQLPTYNPQSHVAKKERTRLRSAETAVHLIPLLLLLCAIVLWWFSNPEDLRIVGDGDDTRSSLFSDQEARDFQPAKQLADGDTKDG